MSKSEKVYVKESNVQNIGKGLFANTDIKKGSIIVEFKGKLRKPKDSLIDQRSCIYFNDNYILECPADDLASYANDAINFTKKHRKLMEALSKNEPLYKKHKDTKINASIKLNDKLHRAFLIAEDDIVPNEEIFCHYGFNYWFQTEITKIGFLQEDIIDKNGFPEMIFMYPAFKEYIKEFYPKVNKIEAHETDEFYDVVVYLSDGNNIIMPMTNYAKKISRIQL